ncbi:hypothetical protein D3C85_1263810 [compost metagenome]
MFAKCADIGVEMIDFGIEAKLHLRHVKGDGLGLAAEFDLQTRSQYDAFGANFALEEVAESLQAAALGLHDQVSEIAFYEGTQISANRFNPKPGLFQLGFRAAFQLA